MRLWWRARGGGGLVERVRLRVIDEKALGNLCWEGMAYGVWCWNTIEALRPGWLDTSIINRYTIHYD